MSRMFLGTLLFVVGIGAADRLVACGDKYLNLGLGTHYRRSAAERRAADILLYASPGTELSRIVAAQSVEGAMRRAGYQPIILSLPADLDAALRSRTWDVIVVDARDTQSVAQRLQKTGAPHLVPVLTRPTKEELRQAEKIYDTVLSTPTKDRAFVDVVDDAMDVHVRELKAQARAKASAR
jgi:hypothetical protein